MTPLKITLLLFLAIMGGVALAGSFSGPLFTFFLMENLGLSFDDASYSLAIHGIVAMLVAMIASGIFDAMPAMRVAIPGIAVAWVLRLLIPSASLWLPTWIFVILLLVLVPLADVMLGIPLVLARKRVIYAHYSVTEREGRLSQFTMLDYGVTNFVSIIANVVYDAMRSAHETLAITTANSLASYLASASYLLVLILAIIVLVRIDSADRALVDKTRSIWDLTVRDHSFWRFMVLCVALVFVRTLFRHAEFTLPVYMERTMGRGESHFALVQSLNPLLIIIGTIVIAWRFRDVAHLVRDHDYMLILVGTAISSVSPFVQAALLAILPSSVSIIVPAVVGIILFSVGEIIWSPLFNAYALKIAPEGAEAAYTSFAALPLLAARIPASVLSNWVVARFCPAAGAQCNGTLLWLAIGLSAIPTPFILLAGRQWLDTKLLSTEQRL